MGKGQCKKQENNRSLCVRICRYCREEIEEVSPGSWFHKDTADAICEVSFPAGDLRVQHFAKPVDEGLLVIQDEKPGIGRFYWKGIKAKVDEQNKERAAEDLKIFDKLEVMACPAGCLRPFDERVGRR